MRSRMTLLIAFLFSLVVMLATALTVVATRDPFGDRQGAPPDTTVVVVDQQALRRSVPSLSAEQRQRAIDLVTRDPRITLDGRGQRPPQPAEALAWTTTSGDVLGAVLTFRLPRGVDVDGQWLGLVYDQEERTSPPYQSVPYVASLRNVTAVTVFVDLQRDTIAAFGPDADAQVVGTPQAPPGLAAPTAPKD
jgi:hypothetical protein